MSLKRSSSSIAGATLKRYATYRPKRSKNSTRQGKRKQATVSNDAFVARVQKAMVRISEPKYYIQYGYGGVVGQVTGNSSGHHTFALPGPTQGTGVQNRIGNKITLTGIELGMTHYSQNIISDTTLKMYFVMFSGNDGGQFAMSEFMEPNAAVNAASIAVLGGGPYIIYDTTCSREQAFNTQYRTIKTLEVKIPGTMVTSASGIVTSHADKYWIPLSGEEYHYNDTATQPVNQILYVVTVASMGNSNNITASTLVGIPKQIVSSGINFNFNAKLHYRDIWS